MTIIVGDAVGDSGDGGGEDDAADGGGGFGGAEDTERAVDCGADQVIFVGGLLGGEGRGGMDYVGCVGDGIGPAGVLKEFGCREGDVRGVDGGVGVGERFEDVGLFCGRADGGADCVAGFEGLGDDVEGEEAGAAGYEDGGFGIGVRVGGGDVGFRHGRFPRCQALEYLRIV